jgi:hypothetical protein
MFSGLLAADQDTFYSGSEWFESAKGALALLLALCPLFLMRHEAQALAASLQLDAGLAATAFGIAAAAALACGLVRLVALALAVNLATLGVMAYAVAGA